MSQKSRRPFNAVRCSGQCCADFSHTLCDFQPSVNNRRAVSEVLQFTREAFPIIRRISYNSGLLLVVDRGHGTSGFCSVRACTKVQVVSTRFVTETFFNNLNMSIA